VYRPIGTERRSGSRSDSCRGLKATQDELLAMAQKVGATESEIIILQVQAAELRADRDAWRQQAERLAAPVKRRPWWRRLTG
jgi:hypothetical protein